MAEKRRQKPIPVTTGERKFIEDKRAVYEQITGESGDWGKYLREISLLALVGLKVYALAKVQDDYNGRVSFYCPTCSKQWGITLPFEYQRFIEFICPSCDEGILVDTKWEKPE